jgi:hypothetical protein
MAFLTEALDRSAILLTTHVDDGPLARIPDPCVMQASRLLPDPAGALDDEMSVDVIADRTGPVRLTFKKRRYCRPNG